MLKKRKLLTRLILMNSLALLGFLGGILWLGQGREDLTDTYRNTLTIQAQIMAEALGETAISDAPEQNLDKLTKGQVMTPSFSLYQVAPVLRRVMIPSQTRAWVYHRDGSLLIESQQLTRAIISTSIVQPIQKGNSPQVKELTEETLIYKNGLKLEEVNLALKGKLATQTRYNQQGQQFLTVAVPIKSYRAIIGVLLLSSPPNKIDLLINKERQEAFQLFGLILIVTIILSIVLAGTITLPIKRLSFAIRRFQYPIEIPEIDTIPDLSDRGDEIGELSLALRDMLRQLHKQIHQVESFAADVAHELKNPLASIHSAVETLTETTSASDKEKLLKILQNDVYRMTHLLNDISESSRLDAQLTNISTEKFNLVTLIKNIVETSHTQQNIVIETNSNDIFFIGHPERIVQIIQNLIDNACSFSAEDSKILIIVAEEIDNITIKIIDEGKGIEEHNLERIFERFYTDRRHSTPSDKFTSHSGLGLSISRQLARLYGGDLYAQIRQDKQGACFTITLPLQGQKI